MGAIKTSLQKNIRYWILIAMCVILFVLFSVMSDSFLSIGTMMNILRQNAVYCIASLGMLLAMLTGGLDLSIGTTGALATILAAMFLRDTQLAAVPAAAVAFLIIIVTGVVVGALNGALIGYLNISPFMTTLAMQFITSGAAMAISANNRIIVENKIVAWIGAANIKFQLANGVMKLPVSLILVIVSIAAVYILIRCTKLGRNIYAVGGNRTAARCSGINANLIIFVTYVICAVLMCIAATVWIGRTSAATPSAGAGVEFTVLTCVIIGGCSLAGGVGTIGGTLLGVLLMALINSGLAMVNTPVYSTYWIQGGLILISVFADMQFGHQRVHHVKDAHRVTGQQIRHNEDQVLQLIKNDKQTCLELSHISKEFPGVKALDDVSLKIERGKVHAIMGENGAGKSTLMKVLTGVYSCDNGTVSINGLPIHVDNPTEAASYGISIIYQEFALVPLMSIAQNVFLGKEIPAKIRCFIDRKKMKTEAARQLAAVNMHMDTSIPVSECKVGQQQMIEIGKAIGSNAWVVVMDEPTGAITEEEKNRLFGIIRDLKEKNVAIVYISHRMAEIFEIADEVTVLRDGQHVMTAPVSEVNEQMLIRAMVGRELSDIFNREKAELGDVVLDVKNLERKGVFAPISFQVRAGEVLGFSGLIGAGRTEIMRCLFGLDKFDRGEIYVNGKSVHVHTPQDAIHAGICMVSEDRRREGIIPPMSVKQNIVIPSLPSMSKGGFVSAKKESAVADEYISKLNIKTPTVDQLIRNLSGGNQQKVCLAKWLAVDPKIIIFDEPTRGIDVGAKAEIHKIIEQLAKQGMAIILISSELPEILGASDRIIVLYEGVKFGEYVADETVTQEVIMASASGIQACPQ